MKSRIVADHRIVELVGKGGMGHVYRAVHVETGVERALKILPGSAAQDPERRARFLREIEIMGELDHPHLLSILDAGSWEGRDYLLMELLRGENLEQRFLRTGPLSTEELARIGRDVASALAYLHDRNVLHRDVKPGNVFLDEMRGPVLMDFGLAKDEKLSAITQDSDEVFGSVTYVPPERLRGEAFRPSSDFYQLGLSLLEGAVGRHVFTGRNPGEVMVQVLERRLPAPEELGPDLRRRLWPVLDRCLAPAPMARHADARTLERAFAAVLAPAAEGDDTLAIPRKEIEKANDPVGARSTHGQAPPLEPPPPPSLVLRLFPATRHLSWPSLVAGAVVGACLLLAVLLRSIASPPLEIGPIRSETGPGSIRLSWTSSLPVQARFLVTAEGSASPDEYHEARALTEHAFELAELERDRAYHVEIVMEPFGLRRRLDLRTEGLRLVDVPRFAIAMDGLVASWTLSGTTPSEFELHVDGEGKGRRIRCEGASGRAVFEDLPAGASLRWTLRTSGEVLDRGALRLGPRQIFQTPEGRNRASDLEGHLAVRQGPLIWKDLVVFADTNGNLYVLSSASDEDKARELFTWRAPRVEGEPPRQIHGLALDGDGRLLGLLAGSPAHAFRLDLPWRRKLAERLGADPSLDENPAWRALAHEHGEWILDLGRPGRYRGLLSTWLGKDLLVAVKTLGRIELLRLDPSGPAVRWALPFEAIRYRTPCIDGTVAYLPLTALASPTRSALEADPFEQPPGRSESGWTFPPSPFFFPEDTRGALVAVDLERGRELWRFPLDGPTYAVPSVDPSTGLLLVSSMESLYALAPRPRLRAGRAGDPALHPEWGEWRLELRGIISRSMRLKGRTWIPWRRADHTLLIEMARPAMLELVDGRPLPTTKIHMLPGSIRLPMYQTFVGDPVVHGGKIYLSCLGHVYRWDPATSRLDWHWDSGHIVGSELVIAHEQLFFGTENGRLFRLDLDPQGRLRAATDLRAPGP